MLSKKILFLSNQRNDQTKDMEVSISLKYPITIFSPKTGVKKISIIRKETVKTLRRDHVF